MIVACRVGREDGVKGNGKTEERIAGGRCGVRKKGTGSAAAGAGKRKRKNKNKGRTEGKLHPLSLLRRVHRGWDERPREERALGADAGAEIRT